MIYYVIDAFTERKFCGNPAGVVIHENLSVDFMQKFAEEVRFSETAFVKKIDESNFEIRFFTPTAEVELCGHATIASFRALLDSKIIRNNNKYFMKTLVATLPVYVDNSYIMMEQAEPILGKTFHDYSTLAEIFKINSSGIGDMKYNLVPQAASTGLWDIMLPLKSKEVLYSLNPDFKKLAEYSRVKCVGGVHAFTLDSVDSIAMCRNFCPLFGIPEEAATGTSNGALLYYLYKNDVINKFEESYTFLQGHSMGRPSEISVKIVNKNNPKIMVGGKAVVISRGELI
ncbi:MAG: PhzF family phenazine biosynthesis protein [Solirubrobacterales bacterium]